MKKTLFVTMLAAALLGGQVFAAIPTKLDGINDSSSLDRYGLRTANSGEEATGAYVTVTADNAGENCSAFSIIGGQAAKDSANKNTVIMHSGEVKNLTGGYSRANASSGCTSNNNVVIMHGGIVGSSITGGQNPSGSTSNNQVYLVGKGATASIKDAQGKANDYTGDLISVASVVAAQGFPGSTNVGNTLHVYGTGITITMSINSTNLLNFHITDGLAEADAPMLTHSYSTQAATGPALTFHNDDKIGNYGFDCTGVTDWSAFEGKSITLIQAASLAIKGLENDVDKDIVLMNGAGTATTAQLVLSNEGKTLSLKFAAPTPEPTTGTLSLLALAGLCVRRRRK